jgi:alanine dehydrogenase
MTLMINNHDVEQVLTMEMTLDALEESYLALVTGAAVCRPRIDIRIRPAIPPRIINGARWRAARPPAISPSA